MLKTLIVIKTKVLLSVKTTNLFRSQLKKPVLQSANLPRLYAKIRPKARYFNSLRLLSDIKAGCPEVFTKSGLMVGLGEYW